MHAHVSVVEKKSEIRSFWSLDEKKHINTDISFDTTHSLSFISFGLVSIGLRANNAVSLRKNARKH